MNRWPQWMHDALRLGPREVARVRPGLPGEDVALIREVTAASDEAVELLIRRARHRRVQTTSKVWWAVPALAAALVWLLWAPAPRYNAPDVPMASPVSLTDAGTVDLGPSIRMDGLGDVIVEQADAQGTVVRVARGSARFDVDPEGPHRQLTVLAADAQVRVTGTQFVVQALYDSVHVRVLRGRVEVTRHGQSTDVAAGSAWSHRGETEVVAVTDETAGSSDAAAQDRAVALDNDTDGAAVVDSAPPRSPPVRDGRPSIAAAPQPIARPSAPTANISPERAYAAVLDSLDSQAPAAEVARDLDAFVRQWPDAPLTVEVRALRLELAAELEQPAAVVADLDRWLSRYPDHPRHAALLELRATVARDGLQDCRMALPSYRQLASTSTGGTAARAEAWRGLCALQVGDRAQAREALTRARELGVPESLLADVMAAEDLLAGP